MNVPKPFLLPPRRHLPFFASALALLLWPGPAGLTAVPPLGGLTSASVTTFTGNAGGALALLPDVGAHRGDYEQQETRLKVSRYQDESDGSEGGVRWMQGRYYWVDFNGEGHYQVETILRKPDGSIEWERTSEPFDFHYEQRDDVCQRAPGIWQRVKSRTSLALGYEVSRYPLRSYHRASNPLPVTIGYWGRPTPSGCAGPPDYLWHESRVALAPRRALDSIPFPRNQLELIRVELTPYLIR